MQRYTTTWFDLTPEVPDGKCSTSLEVYLASEVDARIPDLERGVRQLLALIDEIDTSSGEEVKGFVYYEAKKLIL